MWFLNKVEIFFLVVKLLIMSEEAKKSKLEEKLALKPKSCWEVWDKKTIDKVFAFAEDYKDFLGKAKTERLAVYEIRKLAEKEGFVEWGKFSKKADCFRAGDKVYLVNRNKTIILAVKGKRAVGDGLRFILAHIDSPRLDLKLRPLYEDTQLAFLKTHYYGGIKKYQWPALPLAMHGVIVLRSGRKIEVNVGDDPRDPIFMIGDLLPHLAKKQLEKKLKEAIGAEELNLVVGSIPLIAEKGAKEKVKLNILNLLNREYGIKEEDFVSADLEIVPAGRARDLGWDRSMVAGYGQDDRVCSYAAVRALFGVKRPEFTSVVILTDKEETGSRSNTGMTSRFWTDFVRKMLFVETGEESEIGLRDALAASEAISADVTAAFNPDHKDVYDPRNQAKMGFGLAVEKYTGHRGKYSTNEAHAEYMAKIRRVLSGARVPWQPAQLGKVDVGGGGTVAMFLAEYGMDVLDAGVALLNMHAPFEIASKADIYAAYLGYGAFLFAS